MAKYRTYSYDPVNPEKFKGETIPVILKSSWELEFAKHCDLLPSVLSWSYETTHVPYKDPITNKQKIYIPDFFVKIAQSDGYEIDYVFEIKPMHEQLDSHARNRQDAALIARNNAKWAAASMWADRHSAIFEVINENDIFGGYSNKKGRMHPVATFSHTHSTKPISKKLRKVTQKRYAGKKKPLVKRSRVGKAGVRKISKSARITKR